MVTLRALLAVLIIWSPKAIGLVTLITATGTGVPVPVSTTVCGLPAALSVMLIAPLRAPVPMGVNATPIWQLLPGASELAQSGGFALAGNGTRLNGAPTLMLLSARLAKPVLVTVTFCVGLVVLTVCAAKVSTAGAMLMPGTGAAVPLPERLMRCGDPVALLATLMKPLIAATLRGVKVTLRAQFAPAATCAVEIGQVEVKPKSPVPVMLLMVSGPVPVLVRATAVAGLVVLTVRAPKLMLVGENVTAGAGATVTMRVTLLEVALLPALVTMSPAGTAPV